MPSRLEPKRYWNCSRQEAQVAPLRKYLAVAIFLERKKRFLATAPRARRRHGPSLANQGSHRSSAPPLRALSPARSCHGVRARLLKVNRCGHGIAPASVFATAFGQPASRSASGGGLSQPPTLTHGLSRVNHGGAPPAASRPRSGSSALRSGALALAYPGPPRRPATSPCTRAVARARGKRSPTVADAVLGSQPDQPHLRAIRSSSTSEPYGGTRSPSADSMYRPDTRSPKRPEAAPPQPGGSRSANGAAETVT